MTENPILSGAVTVTTNRRLAIAKYAGGQIDAAQFHQITVNLRSAAEDLGRKLIGRIPAAPAGWEELDIPERRWIIRRHIEFVVIGLARQQHHFDPERVVITARTYASPNGTHDA